jgi:hypothetical protein
MTESGPQDYESFGFGDLERTPHSRRCATCKLFLRFLTGVHDPRALVRGKNSIIKHQYSEPPLDSIPCAIPCCVLHDVIAVDVAETAVRLSGGERPLEFGPRSSVVRTSLSKYSGFKHLWMSNLTSLAYPGELVLHIRRKEARVHVLAQRQLYEIASVYSDLDALPVLALMGVSPPGQMENLERIWAAAVNYEKKHLPELRQACRRAYGELKEVAEFEVAFHSAR